MIDNFLKVKQRNIIINKTPIGFYAKDKCMYNLDWIINCPPEIVLKLRNTDHVLSKINQNKEITIKDHQNFLSNYLTTYRLDFMIKNEEENIFIGGVNLSKTILGWEIGKYIGNKNYERLGIAKRATSSMIKYISTEFKDINEIFAKTKKDNINNIKLNEGLGFLKEKIVSEEFLLMKKEI